MVTRSPITITYIKCMSIKEMPLQITGFERILRFYFIWRSLICRKTKTVSLSGILSSQREEALLNDLISLKVDETILTDDLSIAHSMNSHFSSVFTTEDHANFPTLDCIVDAFGDVKSFSTGLLPKDWKNADITPLHKKGSKSSRENYHPISLTLIVCRIGEKIVFDRMI